MNNRKYLVIWSLILLSLSGLFVFLANVFSLTYENNDQYEGPFSDNISAYKNLIKYLVFIPLITIIPILIIKVKRRHTYGIYKSNIKYNIYYSIVFLGIQILLVIFIFLASTIIHFIFIAWTYAALFVAMSYLEGALTYKLYFY